MLKSVEVGCEPKKNTLVVTPEFFTYIRAVANESWGAHVRLRFHPWVYQWVAVDPVRSTPDESQCFDVDRVPILIPKNQFVIFSGKVLGHVTVIPGFRVVGFVRAEY